MPLIDDETGSVAEEEGECLRRRVDRFHPGTGDGALPLNEGRARRGHCTGGPLLTSHVDNSQTTEDDCILKALQFSSNKLSQIKELVAFASAKQYSNNALYVPLTPGPEF